MERKWSIDGLTYTEACRQPYENLHIAAGFVSGHAIDTMYLELHRDDTDFVFVLLRPDEAAAIAYVLSGALYSLHIGPKEDTSGH